MGYFEDVDIFDDGWVFLLGGSNDVRKYWIDKTKISVSTLREWKELYDKRLEFFQRNKIEYLSIFPPEKLSVYSDKTPYHIDDQFIPSLQLIDYLKKEFDQDYFILDLLPYLRSQSEKFLTYHKTDSHWGFYGVFSAYQLIQKKLGEPLFNDALNQPKLKNWNTMDLGGRFEPPLKEETFYYRPTGNFKRVFANELVEFKETEKRENDSGLHVGSYVIYENTSYLSNKTIMIFGDSFSEYREHLLTGLMAETYKTVHFIWNSNLDYSLIEKVCPDIVLSELAERFITTVPSDTLELSEFSKNILSKN